MWVPAVNVRERLAPREARPAVLDPALGREVRRRVDGAEAVWRSAVLCSGGSRKPSTNALAVEVAVDDPVEQAALALDAADRAHVLRPLHPALVVRRRRVAAELGRPVRPDVGRQPAPGAVEHRDVLRRVDGDALEDRARLAPSSRTSRAGSARRSGRRSRAGVAAGRRTSARPRARRRSSRRAGPTGSRSSRSPGGPSTPSRRRALEPRGRVVVVAHEHGLALARPGRLRAAGDERGRAPEREAAAPRARRRRRARRAAPRSATSSGMCSSSAAGTRRGRAGRRRPRCRYQRAVGGPHLAERGLPRRARARPRRRRGRRSARRPARARPRRRPRAPRRTGSSGRASTIRSHAGCHQRSIASLASGGSPKDFTHSGRLRRSLRSLTPLRSCGSRATAGRRAPGCGGRSRTA